MAHSPEAANPPNSAAPRAVTLHDVAREAGVAVSTASRALSKPDRVNARTRDHVQAIARRLDYQPNRVAQTLLTGRTQMFALLVPDITNPHNFGLIRGAEAQARAAGYTLVIGDSQEDADLEKAHAERLGSVVDGLILAPGKLTEAQLQQLQKRRPVVLHNRLVPGFPSVITDSADGSRQIIEHLAAHRHRSIAYLGGPQNYWSDGERWRALHEHASAAGIEIVRRGPFPPTVEHGAAAADIGLASGATALIGFNDLLAIGVLQRLAHLGVDVPGQISVVGYDDIFGSDFCRPPLTTVTSPAEAAGRALIDLLLGTRGPEPDPRILLPTRLRVRDSTGSAPRPGQQFRPR